MSDESVAEGAASVRAMNGSAPSAKTKAQRTIRRIVLWPDFALCALGELGMRAGRAPFFRGQYQEAVSRKTKPLLIQATADY